MADQNNPSRDEQDSAQAIIDALGDDTPDNSSSRDNEDLTHYYNEQQQRQAHSEQELSDSVSLDDPRHNNNNAPMTDSSSSNTAERDATVQPTTEGGGGTKPTTKGGTDPNKAAIEKWNDALAKSKKDQKANKGAKPDIDEDSDPSQHEVPDKAEKKKQGSSPKKGEQPDERSDVQKNADNVMQMMQMMQMMVKMQSQQLTTRGGGSLFGNLFANNQLWSKRSPDNLSLESSQPAPTASQGNANPSPGASPADSNVARLDFNKKAAFSKSQYDKGVTSLEQAASGLESSTKRYFNTDYAKAVGTSKDPGVLKQHAKLKEQPDFKEALTDINSFQKDISHELKNIKQLLQDDPQQGESFMKRISESLDRVSKSTDKLGGIVDEKIVSEAAEKLKQFLESLLNKDKKQKMGMG